jgi:hypothetical protein
MAAQVDRWTVDGEQVVQTGGEPLSSPRTIGCSTRCPPGLIITQGSTVLSNEPMLEYWSA